VESPAGDDTRSWGPPFIEYADGTRDAAYFHATNRGKRSVTADFTTTGQAFVRELVADADVVIENFKLGGLVKYGLSTHSIRVWSIARSPALDRMVLMPRVRAMTSSSRACRGSWT
jgi:crotonobetainyl-CoA:carnitine CoA-transferase CaiB-like acyl-CoA transferase